MRYLRVLIGVALILASYRLHGRAMELANESIGFQEYIPPPPGHADTMFGDDPFEVAKRPESIAKRKAAKHLEYAAIATRVLGPLLILSAFIPRRRRPPEAPFPVPVDAPQPSPLTEHAKENPCASSASS